jgi:radical SAM protein with 4Fe4S-binding SPASM domain
MVEVRPYLEKPAKLWLQVNNTCNQNCIWCYGKCTPDPRPDEWSTQQLKDFIDQLVNDDVFQIYIEGGEPFNRPDFMEILRYAQGRLLVWVRSNGSMIDADLAKEIKAANVGTMVIDLMAARKETHDYLAGQEGSFERTTAAIEHLVANNVTLITSMVLNRANKDQFQEYVDLVYSLGSRKVALLRPYPIGRMRERWSELSVGLDEMMAVIENTKIPADVHLMQSWHPKDGNCCWENAGVDAYGRSKGCSYLRELVDFGDARNTTLRETWDHPTHQLLRSGKVDDHCSDCATNEGTEGGCRAAARIFKGSFTASDPMCITSNKGVNLHVLSHPEVFQEIKS